MSLLRRGAERSRRGVKTQVQVAFPLNVPAWEIPESVLLVRFVSRAIAARVANVLKAQAVGKCTFLIQYVGCHLRQHGPRFRRSINTLREPRIRHNIKPCLNVVPQLVSSDCHDCHLRLRTWSKYAHPIPGQKNALVARSVVLVGYNKLCLRQAEPLSPSEEPCFQDPRAPQLIGSVQQHQLLRSAFCRRVTPMHPEAQHPGRLDVLPEPPLEPNPASCDGIALKGGYLSRAAWYGAQASAAARVPTASSGERNVPRTASPWPGACWRPERRKPSRGTGVVRELARQRSPPASGIGLGTWPLWRLGATAGRGPSTARRPRPAACGRRARAPGTRVPRSAVAPAIARRQPPEARARGARRPAGSPVLAAPAPASPPARRAAAPAPSGLQPTAAAQLFGPATCVPQAGASTMGSVVYSSIHTPLLLSTQVSSVAARAYAPAPTSTEGQGTREAPPYHLPRPPQRPAYPRCLSPAAQALQRVRLSPCTLRSCAQPAARSPAKQRWRA
eukprot:scaffold552_cov526-Prasinococcus_capsulatus_cf.AAC.31